MCCGAAVSAEGRNLALGAPYTFEPAARYDLTRDAGDATQLTDGHYARGHFWASRDAVGWVKSGLILIEIDLGAVQSINQICFNTARGKDAGVSFPEVDVLISLDRKQYGALGDAYQSEPHEDGGYLVQKFCTTDLAAVGRYVVLAVQPRGAFTFLDEIEVLGGDDGVANNVYSPASLIKREDIGDALKARSGLGHRKESLARLAARLRANPASARTEVQHQIKSFASKLGREKVSEPDALEKLQDELFALHRLALSDNFQEPLIVWRKNPWAAFSQIDSPTSDTLINGGLDFELMCRGSASNAFVLTNNSDLPQRFTVDVTLEGLADATPEIGVREVVQVVAANHEMIGDALKPLGDGDVTLKPGESKQIWLTALAGAAAPGEYVGKVSVVSIQESLPTPEILLRVKVWSAAFPERQHVFVNTWPYSNGRAIEKVTELAMRDLIAHHANVIVLHPSQIPFPSFRASVAGEVDYTKADEVLSQYKGAQKRLFFLEFNDEKLRTFDGKYEFMSGPWKLVFKKWVKDWAAHLKAQGLAYRDFAFYPVDEPRNDDEVAILLETAKLIKEVDSRLEIYTTLGKLSSFDVMQAKNNVDIFQVLLSDLTDARVKVLKSLDKEIWTYTAEGGGKSASPIGYYRSQAWTSFQGGAGGIGFWAYADIGWSGTAWDDFDGKRPDFSVIYEGSNGPLSSKRWEAWREGVEDYELLVMARQKLKTGKEVEEFNAKIESVTNGSADYRQLEMTRSYLLSVASR